MTFDIPELNNLAVWLIVAVNFGAGYWAGRMDR